VDWTLKLKGAYSPVHPGPKSYDNRGQVPSDFEEAGSRGYLGMLTAVLLFEHHAQAGDYSLLLHLGRIIEE